MPPLWKSSLMESAGGISHSFTCIFSPWFLPWFAYTVRVSIHGSNLSAWGLAGTFFISSTVSSRAVPEKQQTNKNLLIYWKEGKKRERREKSSISVVNSSRTLSSALGVDFSLFDTGTQEPCYIHPRRAPMHCGHGAIPVFQELLAWTRSEFTSPQHSPTRPGQNQPTLSFWK